MSKQDLNHRHSQTHRATCLSQVTARNVIHRSFWSKRVTVTPPCCAFASGRGGQPGANNGKDETPLIQPSLIIPPPSRGSQYGRNRLLDIAFGEPRGDDDGASGGGGGGGRGNGGGSGWGSGRRGGGGGGGRNRNTGQGGDSSGFFRDRRFGLLPRVLVIVQFLAWSTVLYMLVDTVLNTSSRMARKMWNGARGSRTDRKSQTGTQNPNDADPNGSVASHSMAAQEKAYDHRSEKEHVSTEEEVVVTEEVVEVADDEVAAGQHPPASKGATAATGVASVQQSAALAAVARGSSGFTSIISPLEGTGTEGDGEGRDTKGHEEVTEGGGGGAAVEVVLAQQSVCDAGVVSVGSATCSTRGEGPVENPYDSQPSSSTSAFPPLEQQHHHQQSQHNKQGGVPQARAPFVRYDGARPVEYPTLTLFICILGGVGFFSMLG